jgi:hypothetical protein
MLKLKTKANKKRIPVERDFQRSFKEHIGTCTGALVENLHPTFGMSEGIPDVGVFHHNKPAEFYELKVGTVEGDCLVLKEKLRPTQYSWVKHANRKGITTTLLVGVLEKDALERHPHWGVYELTICQQMMDFFADTKMINFGSTLIRRWGDVR